MKSRFLKTINSTAALAAVLLVVGCAAPTTSTIYVEPAVSQEASGMKRVAVLQFETLHGADITGDVETLLAGIMVNERRYFDVVERQRLGALMTELKLASRGALDERTASKLGRMLAANGMYMGRVSRNEWSDQRFTESRQVCGQYEQKRDKKGKVQDGACQRWNNVQVNCTLRTATFEFSPKLVSVESGSIVYARSHVGEAKVKACTEPAGQGSQPLVDGTRLLADARLVALEGFRRDVAPSLRTRSITLLESTERIASSQARERFKGALEFAKGKRLDRACEIWQEISATESRSPDLAYNLGVCAESNGDPDRALALFNAADRLLDAPNKTISAALERARKDRRDRAKVESQLRR